MAFRLIAFAMGRMGLRRLVGWMSRRFPEPLEFPIPPALHEETLKIVSRVLGVNRKVRIFPASCLVESLTLWWLLRRRRIPADLRIGVRTLTGAFESHAWVELSGVVLNDIEQVGAIYSEVDLTPLLANERRK
jgi:hypothetical protein